MTALASVTLAAGLTLGQAGEANFESVEPRVLEAETSRVDDLWVLHFNFRNPRFIKTSIPGKGYRMVWYMTYKVVNLTGKPRRFIPDFTLVTGDGKVHHDEVLPSAQRAVLNREDPTGKLYDSVSIAKEDLKPSQPEAVPQVYRGVAFWEGIDPKTQSFDVYVTGLSNGYVRMAPEDAEAEEELRRKTLKIQFVKKGDEFLMEEKEIKLVNHEYIYR